MGIRTRSAGGLRTRSRGGIRARSAGGIRGRRTPRIIVTRVPDPREKDIAQLKRDWATKEAKEYADMKSRQAVGMNTQAQSQRIDNLRRRYTERIRTIERAIAKGITVSQQRKQEKRIPKGTSKKQADINQAAFVAAQTQQAWDIASHDARRRIRTRYKRDKARKPTIIGNTTSINRLELQYTKAGEFLKELQKRSKKGEKLSYKRKPLNNNKLVIRYARQSRNNTLPRYYDFGLGYQSNLAYFTPSVDNTKEKYIKPRVPTEISVPIQPNNRYIQPTTPYEIKLKKEQGTPGDELGIGVKEGIVNLKNSTEKGMWDAYRFQKNLEAREFTKKVIHNYYKLTGGKYTNKKDSQNALKYAFKFALTDTKKAQKGHLTTEGAIIAGAPIVAAATFLAPVWIGIPVTIASGGAVIYQGYKGTQSYLRGEYREAGRRIVDAALYGTGLGKKPFSLSPKYSLKPLDVKIDKYRIKEFKDLSRMTRRSTKEQIPIKGKLAFEDIKGMTPKLAENLRKALAKDTDGFAGGSTIHQSIKGVELKRKPQDLEWYTDNTNFQSLIKRELRPKGHTVQVKNRVLYVDKVKLDVNPTRQGRYNIESVTTGNWKKWIREHKGIKFIDPRILIRRSLVGAFERGGKTNAPMARYSKDIPRLLQTSAQAIYHRLNKASEKAFFIEQLNRYGAGLGNEILRRYKPNIPLERMAPIKYRGYEQIKKEPLLNQPTKMQSEVITYVDKTAGYLGGAGAITLQTPKGTFRPIRDLDIYYKNINQKKLDNHTHNIHQIIKRYHKKTKRAKGISHNKIKDSYGKDIADIGIRGTKDKIIRINNIPMRKANQIIADKKQIIKALEKRTKKRITPEEYAKYLVLKGELNLIKKSRRLSELGRENIQGETFMWTTDSGKRKSIIHLQKGLDQKYGKGMEKKVLAHELLHATEPKLVGYLDKRLRKYVPSRYKSHYTPAELWAYSQDLIKAKRGFKNPKPLTKTEKNKLNKAFSDLLLYDKALKKKVKTTFQYRLKYKYPDLRALKYVTTKKLGKKGKARITSQKKTKYQYGKMAYKDKRSRYSVYNKQQITKPTYPYKQKKSKYAQTTIKTYDRAYPYTAEYPYKTTYLPRISYPYQYKFLQQEPTRTTTVLKTTGQTKQHKKTKKESKFKLVPAWVAMTGKQGRLKETVFTRSRGEAEAAAQDIVDTTPDTSYRLKKIKIDHRQLTKYTIRRNLRKKFTRKRDTYHEKKAFQNDRVGENSFLFKALKA